MPAITSGVDPTYVPETPANQGDPGDYGYGNRVIAHWVQPQFETYSTATDLGILAYHFSEIQKVVFYLNGGDPVEVTEKTFVGGIPGYYVTIDGIPDSENNVLTAVVYPNSGPCQVYGYDNDHLNLPVIAEYIDPEWSGRTWPEKERAGVHAYRFSSDFGDTLHKSVRYVEVNGDEYADGLTPETAKKSIWIALYSAMHGEDDLLVDGVTVYLGEGKHDWGGTDFLGNIRNLYRYVTIKPNPANTKAAIIDRVTGDGIRINKIKLEGVEVRPTSKTNTGTVIQMAPATYGNSTHGTVFYAKDVTFDNHSRYNIATNGLVQNGLTLAYYDNCVWKNCYTPDNGGLMRNCAMYDVETDLFGGGVCVLKCRYKDHGRYFSDAHPDAMQWYYNKANTIVYDLKPIDSLAYNASVSQGFFNNPADENTVAYDVVLDKVAFQTRTLADNGDSNFWRALMLTGYNFLIRSSNIGGNWSAGISGIHGIGDDVALLQNVRRIRYAQGNPVIIDNEAKADELKFVMSQHLADITADNWPDVWDAPDATYPFESSDFPDLPGPYGVRYEFNYVDPYAVYTADDALAIMENIGTAGVYSNGDFNGDGVVDSGDFDFIGFPQPEPPEPPTPVVSEVSAGQLLSVIKGMDITYSTSPVKMSSDVMIDGFVPTVDSPAGGPYGSNENIFMQRTTDKDEAASGGNVFSGNSFILVPDTKLEETNVGTISYNNGSKHHRNNFSLSVGASGDGISLIRTTGIIRRTPEYYILATKKNDVNDVWDNSRAVISTAVSNNSGNSAMQGHTSILAIPQPCTVGSVIRIPKSSDELAAHRVYVGFYRSHRIGNEAYQEYPSDVLHAFDLGGALFVAIDNGKRKTWHTMIATYDDVNDETTLVGINDTGISVHEWHDVQVSIVSEDEVRFFVDGVLVDSYEDDGFLQFGTPIYGAPADLRNYGGGGATKSFEVYVKKAYMSPSSVSPNFVNTGDVSIVEQNLHIAGTKLRQKLK